MGEIVPALPPKQGRLQAPNSRGSTPTLGSIAVPRPPSRKGMEVRLERKRDNKSPNQTAFIAFAVFINDNKYRSKGSSYPTKCFLILISPVAFKFSSCYSHYYLLCLLTDDGPFSGCQPFNPSVVTSSKCQRLFDWHASSRFCCQPRLSNWLFIMQLASFKCRN